MLNKKALLSAICNTTICVHSHSMETLLHILTDLAILFCVFYTKDTKFFIEKTQPYSLFMHRLYFFN